MDKQQKFMEHYTPIHSKLGKYCLAVARNEADAKDLSFWKICQIDTSWRYKVI